jgi:hypothetical protein
VAVFGTGAGYEVFEFEGIFFAGVVNVGAVIVNPYFFCLGVFAAEFAVEEEDLCFYAGGTEDAGG